MHQRRDTSNYNNDIESDALTVFLALIKSK